MPGEIARVASDQKQAMHASGREQDGIREFQAGPLANENAFCSHRFVDFQHTEFVQKRPSPKFDFGGFGPGQKFDPNNSRDKDLLITVYLFSSGGDARQTFHQNAGIEKSFQPR